MPASGSSLSRDGMSRFYKEWLTFPSVAEERPDCAAESTLAPTKSTHLSELWRQLLTRWRLAPTPKASSPCVVRISFDG